MHSSAGDELIKNAMVSEELFPASHGAFLLGKGARSTNHGLIIKKKKMFASKEY